MLIEVHILQNHAPSNLNRDDTGSPKEAIFGGHKRARISSQCLKRSIRRSAVFRHYFRSEPTDDLSPELRAVLEKNGIEEDLAFQLSVRTRAMPELVKDILESKGVTHTLALEAAGVAARLGAKAKDKKSEAGEDEAETAADSHEASDSDSPSIDRKRVRTKQTMFLTLRDVETVTAYLRELIDREGQSGLKRVIKKVSNSDKRMVVEKDLAERGFRPILVDMALFGRMVTSDAFDDVEASSQFAHAISTHKVDHEFDYYTAVDDLERSADDQAGAGADMIGDVEYNSACYYKYFNVHVDGLVENLTGEAFKREATDEDRRNARETAAKAMRALIEAACRVTPSGKQNSFAAHQPPSLVWIEVRNQNLPVSYANAFSVPVDPKKDKGLEGNSAAKLKEEAETLAKMYGLEARNRWLLAKGELDILGIRSAESLKVILDELEKVVSSG